VALLKHEFERKNDLSEDVHLVSDDGLIKHQSILKETKRVGIRTIRLNVNMKSAGYVNK